MRAVIQRVEQAKVEVDNSTVGEIKKGLLVFLGIEEHDAQEDIEWLSKKIINLRIFSDELGHMNLSLLDISGGLLLVSQFTLHASVKKGNRPSFIKAAKPDFADKKYEEMAMELSTQLGRSIQTGRFGANMQVSLLNDGPVTIFIDSKNKE